MKSASAPPKNRRAVISEERDEGRQTVAQALDLWSAAIEILSRDGLTRQERANALNQVERARADYAAAHRRALGFG